MLGRGDSTGKVWNREPRWAVASNEGRKLRCDRGWSLPSYTPFLFAPDKMLQMGVTKQRTPSFSILEV